MIGVTKEKVGNIPSLVVVDAEKKQDGLPVVIFFHGFTSAKEHNLPIAFLLAEKGYRVVLPDSELHGEREKDISELKKQISFWDIVLRNVKELEEIKNDLEKNGLILNNRIGVAGTSMGGITTTAALTQYEWIKSAVVLMGSPKITTFAKTLVASFKKEGDLPVTDEQIEALYDELKRSDLSLQPEKLNERPLLFWHGQKDSVVPFDHSFTFYDEVKEKYKNQEDIQFISEKNTDHKVSRPAILALVNWFEKYL
ncbi:alpha/beta fold hydrolase [Oceanobacillus sp. CAU 1775]